MNERSLNKWMAVAGLLGTSVMASSAWAVACQDPASGTALRTWTLDVATGCDTGPGNPNSSADLTALGAVKAGSGTFAGTTWTKNQDIKSGGDTSTLLDVTLDPGSSWGNAPASGTWTLAPNFWKTYLNAVITIHVGGNPNTAPDDFGAFLLTPGVYSGTWSFSEDASVNGGGLSNLAVWTGDLCRVNCTPVPEPASLGLVGLGLAGLGLMRRRRRA